MSYGIELVGSELMAGGILLLLHLSSFFFVRRGGYFSSPICFLFLFIQIQFVYSYGVIVCNGSSETYPPINHLKGYANPLPYFQIIPSLLFLVNFSQYQEQGQKYDITSCVYVGYVLGLIANRKSGFGDYIPTAFTIYSVR